MKKLNQEEMIDPLVMKQILDMDNVDILKLYYGLIEDQQFSWAVVVQNLIVKRNIKNFKEIIKIQ